MEQKADFRSRMLAFRGAGGEHPQLRLRGPAPYAPINLFNNGIGFQTL
ncbi:hypothetical protein [Peribacillus kribbensis]|nr:hypothetical protein [Peribacillus kribbensis]